MRWQKIKAHCTLPILLLSGILTAFPAGADAGPREKKFTNVILIGWDGTDRDALISLLQAGKLPNFQKIIKEGAFINTEISTGKTETKPGWAEILTGYSGAINGVQDNRMKYKPIPKGYTVFERLEDAFAPDGIATIFIAGKRPNLGARGPHRVWVGGPRKSWDREDIWTRGELMPAPETVISHSGEPYFLTKDSLDVYQNGLNSGDNVSRNALECLRRYKKSRFFMFIHFEEPDEQGHVHGGYSPEYTRGIVDDDRWLGMIIAALKKHGIYDKTLIYIVSDHGFDTRGNNHFYEPHTWLITNDPMVAPITGDRKDITPTILARYGLDLKKIYPPLEGKTLSQ